MRDGAVAADNRSWLAARMIERLGHERAEARAFAPLVLASLVAEVMPWFWRPRSG